METGWEILHAMLHCHYKAWQLARSEHWQEQFDSFPPTELNAPIALPVDFLSPSDKLVLTAFYQSKMPQTSSQLLQIIYSDGRNASLRIGLKSSKASKLFNDAKEIISLESPPLFYRNAHCPDCKFHNECYRKLKERGCISLLTGIPPKVILKFNKRGVYSITQLSHLFRPRRRRRHPQGSSNYLWELKARAITEQKTFVICPPELKETPISIFIDFEGLPEEGWVYLIGVIIVQYDGFNQKFSFWADRNEDEKEIFRSLIALLNKYSEG